MRLTDREILLVLAASALTFLLSHDLSTQAHRALARAAAAQGRLEAAEGHLHAALDEAARASGVRARAGDHYELAQVHRQRGETQAALRELRRGLALLGDDARVHAETRRHLLLGLIELSESTGRTERARSDARALLAATEEAHGSQPLAVAGALETLARVEARAGRLDEALTAQRRRLVLLEAELGAEHRAVGSCLSLLGALLRAAGETEKAELTLERSLAVLERAGAPRRSPWNRLRVAAQLIEAPRWHLLGPLNELGLVYRDQGRLAAAQEKLEAALELSAPERFASERSSILANLADVLRLRGRGALAESRALEALEVGEAAVLPAQHRAALHHAAAGLYAAQGRADEARRHLHRAEELGGRRFGAQGPMLHTATVTLSTLPGPAMGSF